MSDFPRNLSVTTSFAALEDFDCAAISFLNGTGGIVEVRVNDSATNITKLPDGKSLRLDLSGGNANTIQVKGASATDGLSAVFHT